MGASQSFISDPQHIATPAEAGDDSKEWRTYDYVIVGGGTAGCVLASRLSEDKNTTVLLIEAGKSHGGNLSTRMPFGVLKALRSEVDWTFTTTPEPVLNGRSVYCAQGKILGGTSSINGMIYQRCWPDDFGKWESLGGLGWGYDDLLPYFLKAEQYHPSPTFSNVDMKDHGLSGPLHTGHPADSAPINAHIVDAWKTLGVPFRSDVNAAAVDGASGVTLFTTHIDPRGQRSSTATGYLGDEVTARPNLTVAVSIMVEKILFSNGEHGAPRAVGVELATGPTSPRFRVAAQREVILCAGAYHTPQLLLLSGIGPADELQRVGIPVVKEHPHVGRNLQDHVSAGCVPFRAKKGSTYDHLAGTLSMLGASIKWFLTGRGPFATTPWPGAAYVRLDDKSLPFVRPSDTDSPPLKDISTGPHAPHIELMWLPIAIFNDAGDKASDPGITIIISCLQPDSSGTVTLKSKSVWDRPLVALNFARDSPHDLEVLVRGVRLALNVVRMEPLASALDLKAHSTDKASMWWPTDTDPEKLSDEDLREFVRSAALPCYHAVSTARMGRTIEESVVDHRLRVHGIEGLRIVDASVFPAQLSGHPAAVVVAVAERAADLIKGVV